MKIEWWPIDRPKPYKNNPRKNDDAVEKVAASLKAYGFRQPIVVDKDGVVIVGHTRLKAAQRLEFKEVPVHVADLNTAQAKAYRLDDNRTAEEAKWDSEALYQELIEMQDEDIDLSALAFEDDELEKLLGDEAEPPEPPMPEVYQIVVECKDEADQERVHGILEQEGIECRVLTL